MLTATAPQATAADAAADTATSTGVTYPSAQPVIVMSAAPPAAELAAAAAASKKRGTTARRCGAAAQWAFTDAPVLLGACKLVLACMQSEAATAAALRVCAAA